MAVTCIDCPDCDGIGKYTYDHPNDPYAKICICETCNGEGVIPYDEEEEEEC